MVHGSDRKELQNLNELVEDLKDLYLSPSFQKFHPLGEDIDIIFDLATTFTDGILWKKDNKNRKEDQLTIRSLLDQLANPCIIEGEAGKGKTTFLKRIAALWASDQYPSLRNFKLVFFVSLNRVEVGLYETICEQLLRIPYKMKKKSFMALLLKLKQEVLFLLDGYDEFDPKSCSEIEALIKKNHQFKNTVIVTTRTESVRMVRQFGRLTAEMGDLSEKSARLLIQNVLDYELADSLLKQLDESSTMKELMKTPLFVVIACAIRMGESNFIPNTQTALFCTLYDLMVEKNKYKTKGLASLDIAKSIKRCGDLALDGVFNQRYAYQQEELSDVREEVLLSAGLLNKYTAQQLRPVYRFFHKSFQEYVAGRRLHELLNSSSEEDISRGHRFLEKISSLSAAMDKYRNLLLYTCGSSVPAAKDVVKHLTKLYQQDSTMLLVPSMQPWPASSEATENVDTVVQQELLKTQVEHFVECGIIFFYESCSKSALRKEFGDFFKNKRLYINTQSIPSYLFDFFEYLPNCLTALDLIKLSFVWQSQASSMTEEGVSGETQTPPKTQVYIPEKAVELFFDWNQEINTLDITLEGFKKLTRKDIKYLGKICCSSSNLQLHIKKSEGTTGELQNILDTFKNMQDLSVESTPLTIKDEQHIVKMNRLKTLYISDLQTERPEGGLIDGMWQLSNIEKLTLDNVNMTENDARTLAENLKNLKNLTLLCLARLKCIGNGMESIVEVITNSKNQRLKEIKLIDCSLTGTAMKILADNLCSLPELQLLDLSENDLAEVATDCVHHLAKSLPVLKHLMILMLPWGLMVRNSLDVLLQNLMHTEHLEILGLQRWSLTDADVIKLDCLLQNTSIQHLDISDNCISSDGLIVFIGFLKNKQHLKFIDISSRENFQPDPKLVMEICQLINKLGSLQEIRMRKWQFDEHDLNSLSDAKAKRGNKCLLKF
ncbi:NLR family CARD domain-containing protein 4-like [Protopterus annectens]|uniref:NLR family CARD domain-containing protein 4-like n=1 Tax=Protopterus annectens TaxID=7888 RepID=UPI001CFAC428|nr:NLR family CARD domain-containing protein 4-like [Protopterus annectens]